MTHFCINCKHQRGDGVKATCASPLNMVEHVAAERYLVTGEVQPVIHAMRGSTCVALRSKHTHDVDATICGPVGAWFEQKE